MHQVTHWVDIASTAVELLLLLRFLQLRFFPAYTFVVLFGAVTVLFDGVSLAVPGDSELATRLFLYSRLVLLFVFPLAAWESFELTPPKVLKLRQLHSTRLVGSMVGMFLVGALFIGFSGDENLTAVDVWGQIGLFVWPISAMVSLVFLWSMLRITRLQKLELPVNTRVLAHFFAVIFILEVVSWVAMMIAASYKLDLDIAAIVLNCAYMAVCLWCIVRLKSLSATVVPESPAQTK